MRCLGLLAVLTVSSAVVWAEGKAPKSASGEVNWKAQVIRAKGAGAPDVRAQNAAQARLGAERAALLDAFRNLLAQVKGISVDGDRRMSDVMQRDEIRSRVEGVVNGYSIVDKRYYSDNGVEVEIEVTMAALSDIVAPDAAVPSVAPTSAPERTATGLVIDARGLSVRPALLPRVLDHTGKPLYSVDSLSSEARKTSGVAAYVQTIDDAKKSMKAGEKPFVVKAEKTVGVDVQLTADDAKKLASINTSFLADGRVVIVLN